MCGRYVSASPPDEIAKYFGADPAETQLEENYNVAPTSEVYAVRARSDDDGQAHRQLATLRWGLVPFWAKDLKVGARMINARSESAAAKPAFRRAFQKRRCLIPADGFYEWAATDQLTTKGKPKKQPFYIYRSDGEPLVFAGLWERWYPKDADGVDVPDAEPVDSCTILTCAANETMAPVHDRMPVMIPPGRWDDWLDPAGDAEALTGLLVPAPDGLLTMHTVTTMVNSVRNNGPELVAAGTLDGPTEPA